MSKVASKNGRSPRFSSTPKYDANNSVLSKTYGARADLRRELADSKGRVAEREEILKMFADCSQMKKKPRRVRGKWPAAFAHN